MRRILLSVVAAAALLASGVLSAARAEDPPDETTPSPVSERFFGQYDADGDGRISRKEWPAFLRPFFPEIDRNGDGFVDRAEDAAYRARPAPEEGWRRRPRRDRLPAPTHANLRYGPHERNVLDLWLAESASPTPVVVFFHGGGFRAGDKRTLNPELQKGLLDAGISVAAANYRLSRTAPFPAPMHDAARALQFLRHHATEYGLDPARFGATGGSAGAGISLWLGFHDDLADPSAEDPVARESSRLSAMVVYGAQSSYDPRFFRELFDTTEVDDVLLPFYGMQSLEDMDDPRFHALFEEASPINHVTADDPPVYLFYPQQNLPLPQNSTSRQYIHHPKFGFVLKEKMDELGVECIVRLREEVEGRMPIHEHVAFFVDKFGVLPTATKTETVPEPE